MAAQHLFAGIPVADYPAARAWYEKLLGRAADFFPTDHEAVWKIVGETGWIYVVADAERAGRALVTVLVHGLDELVAGIAARGVAAGPVEPVVEGTRQSVVTDPDGNRITFAEVAES